KVGSEGGMKPGSRAPGGRRSLSLALSLLLFFDAAAPRGLRARCCELLPALARRGATLPLVAPALTLSFTLLLECQTRLRPLPSAISEIERPLTTDSGSSSRMSGSFAPPASSSFDLIRTHASFSSPALPCRRTRCHRPCSFSPSKAKARCPFLYPLCGSPSGYQRPRSQIMTVPPPYSPRGMVPSNA